MTTPPFITPRNWVCYDNTYELMAGQIPFDDQPAFLVYVRSSDGVLEVVSPRNRGLANHVAMPVVSDTTIVVKAHSVIADNIMVLMLNLENVQKANVTVKGGENDEIIHQNAVRH